MAEVGHSQTTWYIAPPPSTEDSLQFFKEERVEGAIYNVYLKKVRYHTASEEVGIRFHSNGGDVTNSASSKSTFYLKTPGPEEEDDGKARLQWRLEEVRVVKHGTVEKLVEALSSDSGELDSTYVNTFLATYRSFSHPKDVLLALLNRYKRVGEDRKMKQHLKETHRKTIRTVISVWLDSYSEDFREPPHFPCLNQLAHFSARHIPDSDLSQRAKDRITKLAKEEEPAGIISIEDVQFDFHYDLMQDVDLQMPSYLERPVEFESIPNRTFAEQLTYIDAELFKKVIPHHCLGSIWSRRDKKRGGQAQSVYATVNQFNAVSYRVIATILKHPYLPPEERALVMEKWIDIAQELRVQKNFSSLKAIVSGLQSNAIYRLRHVWEDISPEKLELFDELSEIFSEDNNQMMARELLNKEGTAKFADPESTNTIRGHRRRKSGGFSGMVDSFSNWSGWGTVRSRKSVINFDNQTSVVQGTIPYLGTFLTDLTMIDTAIKETNEEGLINFDKKRKEFEVLAQIRLLQSAANLYRIKADPAFFEWFHGIRTYDDKESYDLSCEIEPVTTCSPPTPGESYKGHRKKSSLGFFSPRRPNSYTSMEELQYSTSNLSLFNHNDDADSILSTPDFTSPVSGSRPMLKHSISTGSLRSMDPSEISTSPWKNEEHIVAKVFMETSDNHFSNLYKSVLLTNSDHHKNVMRNILLKYGAGGKPEDYILSQYMSEDKELQLPEKGNVFYAINTNVPEIKFVVRKKSDLERLKAKHIKGKARRKKFTL